MNIINVSGIVVVFLGVFLYKVSLHLSRSEKESDTSDADKNTHFSRISSSDVSDIVGDVFIYEENPRRGKLTSKNSDPDIALRFSIDDEMDEDELMSSLEGASPLRRTNTNTPNGSPINGTPLELDKRESNPEII